MSIGFKVGVFYRLLSLLIMSEGLNLDMIGNFGKIRLKGGLGWVRQNKLHFGRYPRLHFERKDPAPECHLGRDWAELKEYGSGEIFLFR